MTQSPLSHLGGGSGSLLDMGCGEGDYTVFMQEALKANEQADWTGIDISKEAIRAANHFRHISEERVRFTLDLQGESLQQLLGKTPHVWHTSLERQDALKKLSVLSTQIVVNINVFSKNADLLSSKPW